MNAWVGVKAIAAMLDIGTGRLLNVEWDARKILLHTYIYIGRHLVISINLA